VDRVKAMREIFGKGAWLLVLLGLVWIVAIGEGRQSETAPAVEGQSMPLIGSVKGPDLFRAYCASCHGLNGKGGGPAAIALKAEAPDLTVLAMNNGGEFPTRSVREVIMGDKVLAAHGSREMPIWGPIFHQVEADVDRGNVRLENLVKYLQSIQSIPTSKPPTGAELYQKNCAGCHGNDLRGGGSAPYPFRPAPDLTGLARRHGGKFPDAYVTDVLRDGVVLPAHGPAEMPTWGSDFREENGLNSAQVRQRIAELTSYIKSVQAK
jgi:mono/diheme cytochrome c family protein